MDSALDLFRAGASVVARETDHVAVSTMRTVCPECMELVHLVVRANTSYFGHQSRTEASPPCSLRVESWGASSPVRGGPREQVPPNTRFRDALLAAFSLTEPLTAPSSGADAGVAAALMQRVFRESGRAVTASDLPDSTPLLRGWWPSDEGLIRAFLDRPDGLSGRLREDLQDHPELKTTEHLRSVLLLWRHLHLPQVGDDLAFLLRVTAHLFRPILLSDLVTTSLGVLALVPWRVLEALGSRLICDDCGQAYTLPESERPAACSECTKRSLCPECAIPCSGCGDILCERCIFRSCPACSGVLCLTCWHFEWECTSCGTWFCEGDVDEVPEEVDKIECEGCNEPFCADCAEHDLQDWDGETLCESCRDERRQEADEAELQD